MTDIIFAIRISSFCLIRSIRVKFIFGACASRRFLATCFDNSILAHFFSFLFLSFYFVVLLPFAFSFSFLRHCGLVRFEERRKFHLEGLLMFLSSGLPLQFWLHAANKGRQRGCHNRDKKFPEILRSACARKAG